MRSLPPNVRAYLPVAMSPRLRFAAALELVLAQLEAEGYRSLRDVRAIAARFREVFGAVALRDLGPLAIVAWLRHEAHRGVLAPKTIRKHLHFLRKILDRCVVAGALARNPARDVPPDMVPRNRARDPGRAAAEVLSPDELELVLEADLPRQFVTLLGLLALAGLRIGEASALTWGDIRRRAPLCELVVARQFHGKDLAVVDRPKAEQVRRVPIHPALEEVLARAATWFERTFRRPIADHHLVAPWITADHQRAHWREKTALRWWHQAARELGLRETRLHGLRHTFISRLLNAGAADYLVFSLTHSLPADAQNDARAYAHFEWPALCRAVRHLGLALPQRAPRLVLTDGRPARPLELEPSAPDVAACVERLIDLAERSVDGPQRRRLERAVAAFASRLELEAPHIRAFVHRVRGEEP